MKCVCVKCVCEVCEEHDDSIQEAAIGSHTDAIMMDWRWTRGCMMESVEIFSLVDVLSSAATLGYQSFGVGEKGQSNARSRIKLTKNSAP